MLNKLQCTMHYIILLIRWTNEANQILDMAEVNFQVQQQTMDLSSHEVTEQFYDARNISKTEVLWHPFSFPFICLLQILMISEEAYSANNHGK